MSWERVYVVKCGAPVESEFAAVSHERCCDDCNNPKHDPRCVVCGEESEPNEIEQFEMCERCFDKQESVSEAE